MRTPSFTLATGWNRSPKNCRKHYKMSTSDFSLPQTASNCLNRTMNRSMRMAKGTKTNTERDMRKNMAMNTQTKILTYGLTPSDPLRSPRTSAIC